MEVVLVTRKGTSLGGELKRLAEAGLITVQATLP